MPVIINRSAIWNPRPNESAPLEWTVGTAAVHSIAGEARKCGDGVGLWGRGPWGPWPLTRLGVKKARATFSVGLGITTRHEIIDGSPRSSASSHNASPVVPFHPLVPLPPSPPPSPRF
jgi:hypothetical protein